MRSQRRPRTRTRTRTRRRNRVQRVKTRTQKRVRKTKRTRKHSRKSKRHSRMRGGSRISFSGKPPVLESDYTYCGVNGEKCKNLIGDCSKGVWGTDVLYLCGGKPSKCNKCKKKTKNKVGINDDENNRIREHFKYDILESEVGHLRRQLEDTASQRRNTPRNQKKIQSLFRSLAEKERLLMERPPASGLSSGISAPPSAQSDETLGETPGKTSGKTLGKTSEQIIEEAYNELGPEYRGLDAFPFHINQPKASPVPEKPIIPKRMSKDRDAMSREEFYAQYPGYNYYYNEKYGLPPGLLSLEQGKQPKAKQSEKSVVPDSTGETPRSGSVPEEQSEPWDEDELEALRESTTANEFAGLIGYDPGAE